MGYRLIRSSDLAQLKADLATARTRVDWVLENFVPKQLAQLLRDELDATVAQARLDVVSALENERRLSRELIDATGNERAAQTRADMVTLRVNVLENEIGQWKQRAGQPAVVPQIGKSPVGSELFQGAGADLFEDVGDTEAERLRRLDLIAADESIVPPAAANLAPA